MNMIPTPKSVCFSESNQETFPFKPMIKKTSSFPGAIASFISYVEKIYDIAIEESEDATIRVIQDDSMEAEAYRIIVAEDRVTIYAGDKVGANHAFATILQSMQIDNGQILLPRVTIEDIPDCSYRGMMVDLARNWHPFSYLLSYVDMCYFYKVAVLQLHFTDDQSYTLPSDIYPKLSTKERFYTKEQIAELVEYADARGVELLPEIDVPGHCKSFGEAYGELFGTKGVICQHTDSMEAMRNLFRELCDLFPNSKYIHIGGDEAYTMDEWTKCPSCREYAKSVGIDSDMEDKAMLAELMYAHFISEMAEVCFAKGRQPIVWEGFAKTVNDRISKDILVMSWENYYQLTPDLLDAGFKIINCSWNPMYVVAPLTMWKPEEIFDWSIYQWKAVHPSSPYLEIAYQAEPNAQIIGGQLLAWGDHIPKHSPSIEEGVYDERNYLMERLPMLAENTWNVKKACDFDVFEKSVQVLNDKMKQLM